MKDKPYTVTLAWASRKRHIFVDGVLLCEKQHKSAGYSHKGGHYVSYQLEMPDKPKTDPDTRHTHTDGVIPFLPLDEIKIGNGGISRRSICATCQKRYDKMFKPKSGTPVLLLASYCGGDNPKCTNDLPCENCLKMCNVAIVGEDQIKNVIGGYDYLTANIMGQYPTINRLLDGERKKLERIEEPSDEHGLTEHDYYSGITREG